MGGISIHKVVFIIILFLIIIGCSNQDYQLELISSHAIVTDTPQMINSDTPEGEEPVIPEYYLEYTFLILNNGSHIGSNSKMIQLEFKPNEDLEKLLGKDIFDRNPNNGIQGPAYLESDSEGEFILVLGLDREILNKMDKINMAEMLDGTLIVKEGSKKILQLPVNSR